MTFQQVMDNAYKIIIDQKFGITNPAALASLSSTTPIVNKK